MIKRGFVTITIEDDRSSGDVVVGFPIEYLSLSPADLFEHFLKPAIQEAVQEPAVQQKLAALSKQA